MILPNLVMPGMCGFDVLNEIRLTGTVSVIFITLQDDKLSQVRGLVLNRARTIISSNPLDI